MKKIKLNAAKCLKCKQIIQSIHRYNFVECKCGSIFVDGGLDYIRHGYKHSAIYENMSEFEE